MLQDSLEFPVVEGVEGGITDDGQAVVLKLSTVENESIHFCLRHCDLEAFVTYLLLHGGEPPGCGAAGGPGALSADPGFGDMAGELADGMGCLGVTIGSTELMFQLPIAAVSKVAQTLLLVGASDGERALSSPRAEIAIVRWRREWRSCALWLAPRLDARSDAARSCSCGLAAAVACVSIARYFCTTFWPNAVSAAPPPCAPPGWAVTTGSRKQRFMSSTSSQARR